MRTTQPIDGSKNDVRVTLVDSGDLPEEANYVEGVPIDPPDDQPGWLLVNVWLEHDKEEETVKPEKDDKGGRTKVVTRNVNTLYYAMWVRPKVSPKPQKKARGQKDKAEKTENGAATEPTTPVPASPRKKRGRAASRQFNPMELRFADDVPQSYKLLVCPHVAEMLHATINLADGEPVSKEQAQKYSPRCHDCLKRDEENAQKAEA